MDIHLYHDGLNDWQAAVGLKIQLQTSVAIPHEWIPQVLEIGLRRKAVYKINCVNCSVYAVSRNDEIWRGIALEIAKTNRQFAPAIRNLIEEV